MPNAIRFHKSGGPEVLVWEPAPIGKPGPGEARVRHTAVACATAHYWARELAALGHEGTADACAIREGVHQAQQKRCRRCRSDLRDCSAPRSDDVGKIFKGAKPADLPVEQSGCVGGGRRWSSLLR
jgi:hypothetical protein